VDREQIKGEVLQEMRLKGEPYSDEAYQNHYRAKLQPYINIGQLVAGSVIATTGRDPTLAVAAARNALENNFAGPVPLPELGQIPVEIQEGALKTIGDVKETAGEVYDDIRKNPDEYAKEFVLDAIPYATISREDC